MRGEAMKNHNKLKELWGYLGVWYGRVGRCVMGFKCNFSASPSPPIFSHLFSSLPLTLLSIPTYPPKCIKPLHITPALPPKTKQMNETRDDERIAFLRLLKSTPQLFINNLKCWFFSFCCLLWGCENMRERERRKIAAEKRCFAAVLFTRFAENLENDARRWLNKQSQRNIGNNVIVLWLVIGLFWFDVQGFRLGVSTTLHIHLTNLIPSPLKPAASAYFRQHLQRPSKLAFAFLFWHKLTKQASRMERVKRFLFFKQTKNKHKLWKVKQTHIRRASTSIL